MPTYYKLSDGNYAQDFTVANGAAPANGWDTFGNVAGYLSGDASTVTTNNPATYTADFAGASFATIASGNDSRGGVFFYNPADGNQAAALQNTNAADYSALVFHFDATGRENIGFKAIIRDIDGSTGSTASDAPVAVQYRIGATGPWTLVPGGSYTGTTVIGQTGRETEINVTLPSAVAGQGQVQIRVITANQPQNDEMVAIDNVRVTSTAVASNDPGTFSIADTSVVEGNADGALLSFTVSRTGGSAGAATIDYSVALGTASASDFVTAPASGTVSFAAGETSKTISFAVRGDAVFEPNETIGVTLTGASAGAISGTAASATGTILNDDAAPAGTLSIADASLVEGDSGASDMVFTVTRSGGSTGAVSASYAVNLTGTASADDLSGPLTGTVGFADGQQSATIRVGVAGDTRFEANETFGVTLSAPTGGASLGAATATGTITDNDVAPPPRPLFINELHYDPIGTDQGEKIEIAGPAGTDLTGWRVVLYNGNGGVTYDDDVLTGLVPGNVIPDQGNGYGTVVLSYASNGIQNGSPDGIALVAPDGTVVQFLSYEGTMTATNGPAAGMTSTDIGVSEESVGVNASLQLTGTGAVGDDFRWELTEQNTFGQQNSGQTFLPADGPGYLRIADASVAEGDSGVKQMVFTISRSGGTAGEASVDYNLALTGSASAADLAPGTPLSGRLTFGVGEFTKTISIGIAGDTVAEPNETFAIRLANPSSGTFITDAEATGTIRNNDPITLSIMQIQGEGHRSDYVDQPITTTGIVTAVGNGGFYIQDAAGDGNARTSDAIFVATTAKSALAVGTAVQVTGTVVETGPTAGLTLTQFNFGSTITTLSTGNALPAAAIIGVDGLRPPSEVIDDDGLTSYDPTTDGLDFWETLEGMRVTVDEPLVVARTEGGETWTVASGGAQATGVTAAGGIAISEGDYNPERILIDSVTDVFNGFAGSYQQGDRLADVTGILTYGSGTNSVNYRLIPTAAAAQTFDANLQPEVTALTGDADHLTVASFNMENLDPTDPASKFTLLAQNVVTNLRAPDIILAQEIQDADGAGTGANYSGTVTANLLIDAIKAAGGPDYAYVEVAPTGNNQNGGEPGGNIRPGIFYRVDRVDYVEDSITQITGPAYSGTRKPLVADFEFNGQVVTVIDLHSTSRLGSTPLFGSTQPAFNAGDAARTAQAQGVRDYIAQVLSADPDHNIVVGGDFNGFDFETALRSIEGAGMTNLNTLIPVEERYDYLFEGNLQQIDHLLVSGNLLGGASFDAVHINTIKTVGTPEATDHDQVLARLYLPNAAPNAGNDTVSVDEDATTGNLVATLLGNDTDDRGPLKIVSVGTAGTAGTVIFDADTQTLRYAADADAFDQLSTGRTTADSFTYTVSDGAKTSNATVSVTVTGVADGATRTGGSTADNLAGTAGEDRMYGNSGNDTLTGNDGADFLAGGIGNDVLRGENGRDTLTGGAGADQLFGGAGADYLSGEQGNDTLTGGLGEDTFAFAASGGRDTIADYEAGIDRILLANNLVLQSSTVGDVNRDGVADLTLSFSGGSSAIVLGVGSIDAITIVRTSDPLITDPTF